MNGHCLLSPRSLAQRTWRVNIRACLGQQVFGTYARPLWKQHLAKDPKALAAFNKAVRGITFRCAINCFGGNDGSDPIITCYAIK